VRDERNGRLVLEAKVATEPEALIAVLSGFNL
jgi:hypothetical protein